ncbi:MAG: Cysteine--tRNA ligase [Candidatus Omnitrophica bacterium]|nr:Cysteine--tRNA ligase [Candidatus Omnitrophota bacterium]
MALLLRNSLTKASEPFVPLTPGRIGFYACGPTVYDEPHIGHLRSAYTFDWIRKYLGRSGYQVTFVRNVTDVDDKIIEKARQEGCADLRRGVQDVSERYLRLYHKDLELLGVAPPDHEPRATQHIPAMIALIQRLIDRGAAYAQGGDVYFSVKSFTGYGKLSRQDVQAMLEHVRVDPNDKKRDPLDFALWKSCGPDEPAWESPWGPGRPGWHIECSAMSMGLLGESFDIHGGGRDLIFPHHENEIAQSEAASGKTFARTWLHHGLITIEQQKMSKSLKNFVTLTEVRKSGPRAIDELKLLFLGTHYSAPLDYSAERMRMEHQVRLRFDHFYEELEQLRGHYEPKPHPTLARIIGDFESAMSDDLNSPLALTALHALVHESRKLRDPGAMLEAGRLLTEAGSIFGLFSGQRQATEAGSEAWLREAVSRRAEAKARKDYAAADAVRQEVQDRGYTLSDWPGGRTTWRKAE